MMKNRPATPLKEPILVIGLGNPILGDDGVGWRVAQFVEQRLAELPEGRHPVEIDCLSLGGLSLMERMIGYSSVILIDAMTTQQAAPGTVSTFNLNELPNRALGHLCSSHDTTLHNALEVGRKMGAVIPHHIQIVSIEAQQVFDFSESLSPQVEAAIPLAAQQVIDHLSIPTLPFLSGPNQPVELPQGG